MRTIGIIGGMSAESTAHYYAEINKGVREKLGGLHSAEIVMWSVDFAEIAAMQSKGQWDLAGKHLATIAKRLEGAGADCLVLATNTMHKLAPEIQDATHIPLLHIADATAEAIKAAGLKRPGLMATAYTMEQDFYVGRLRNSHGLVVIVPDEADRKKTHAIIYDELCKGVTREDSRNAYVKIAQRLKYAGADCLILGCTEVGMLLNQSNVPMPVFDTTLIHAAAAVSFATAVEHRRAAE
jgi:aspartate racemase